MGFLIRSARPGDLGDLFRLARHLDSYNLPADRGRLRRLVQDSGRSFRGDPTGAAREKYLFVLEDTGRQRVVGSSLVLARHGTKGFPHLYMDLFEEKRRSKTLRKTVTHRCLRLGWTESGPTELGGLVVLPAYRRRPEAFGRWLSFARFLFIAARRRRFQDELLVEFLPAFLRAGVSPFWEFFGRKFTGLSYRRADRMSMDTKEFVLSLFPHGTLYLDFFPEEVIGYLGRVGEEVKPAARILEKLGFRYARQIEPFDGGPYYTADTDRVPLVRGAKLTAWRSAGSEGLSPFLLMVDGGDVRAVAAPAQRARSGLLIAAETAAALKLSPKDKIWSTPFPA